MNMKAHVELLGWINVIGGLIGSFVGIAVFTVLMVVAPISGDADAMVILPVVAFIVGGFLLVVNLPSVIAGIGLLRFAPWSRTLAIVMAVLGLFNFPIGTLVAIYAFWVLTNQEVAELLAAPSQPKNTVIAKELSTP
jgi:hypothetical protein